MAARRERERRRPPAERRYRFATPEPAVAPEETLVEQNGEALAAEAEAAEAPPPRAIAGRSPRSSPPTAARATTRPFSAYKDEYAYVYGDLRRVGAVIGGLLLALVVLYFVLPLLVH